MKLFGNPLQSVNPQVKTIGNTAITKEGTEKVILAEFQTSSENRRVTKIKCYYDESIAEIDNLSISMHLKSETNIFITRYPFISNWKQKKLNTGIWKNSLVCRKWKGFSSYKPDLLCDYWMHFTHSIAAG